MERAIRFELTTFSLATRGSTTELRPQQYFGSAPWNRTKLTQINSLLPHLAARAEYLAVPRGFEPLISCVTGRRVNRYTKGPLNFIQCRHNMINNTIWICITSWTSIFQITIPIIMYSINWNTYTCAAITNTITKLIYALCFM